MKFTTFNKVFCCFLLSLLFLNLASGFEYTDAQAERFIDMRDEFILYTDFYNGTMNDLSGHYSWADGNVSQGLVQQGSNEYFLSSNATTNEILSLKNYYLSYVLISDLGNLNQTSAYSLEPIYLWGVYGVTGADFIGVTNRLSPYAQNKVQVSFKKINFDTGFFFNKPSPGYSHNVFLSNGNYFVNGVNFHSTSPSYGGASGSSFNNVFNLLGATNNLDIYEFAIYNGTLSSLQIEDLNFLHENNKNVYNFDTIVLPFSNVSLEGATARISSTGYDDDKNDDFNINIDDYQNLSQDVNGSETWWFAFSSQKSYPFNQIEFACWDNNVQTDNVWESCYQSGGGFNEICDINCSDTFWFNNYLINNSDANDGQEYEVALVVGTLNGSILDMTTKSFVFNPITSDEEKGLKFFLVVGVFGILILMISLIFFLFSTIGGFLFWVMMIYFSRKKKQKEKTLKDGDTK